MSSDAKILGIYSKTSEAAFGQGGSAQKVQQTTYWFARRRGEGQVDLAPLNDQGLPSGVRIPVAQAVFLAAYTPEPRYYAANPNPFLAGLKHKVDTVQDLNRAGLDAAEMAFCKASLLGVDGGDAAPLAPADQLVVRDELNALLGGTQAHLEQKKIQLNDFAVNLRKSRRHEEAIRYYQGALAVSDQDENLHFNIARAYYDAQNYESCVRHLREAMALNPDFDWAARFLEYIRKKSPNLDARLAGMLKSSGDTAINL